MAHNLGYSGTRAPAKAGRIWLLNKKPRNQEIIAGV